MIEQSDLDHIKALMAKATPGTLRVGELDKHGQRTVMGEHFEICTCWHHSVGSIECEMEYNAELIAASHNLLPRIIEELEAARKTIAYLRETEAKF